MRYLVCLDDPPPVNGGACTLQAWADSPSLFAGWAVADFREVGGAVLVVLAIAYIIRLLHQWSNQQ